MYLRMLLIFLLPLGFLRAQGSDKSISFNIWPGLGPTEMDEAPGGTTVEYTFATSLDLELRRGERFSWVLTVGQEVEEGKEFQTVPFPIPGDTPISQTLEVERQFRRTYVGGGAQFNQLFGPGDLNITLLATLGQNKLVYGDAQDVLVSQPNNAMADIQTYADRGKFYPVYQTGGRLQLTYTTWAWERLAVRAGVFMSLNGGLTIGNYDRTNGRYKFHSERVTNSDVVNIITDYESFITASPDAIRLYGGLGIGVVYRLNN